MGFQLESAYSPMGDQPEAIDFIVDKLDNHHDNVVLWGVTGSGKTFTMANVIAKMDRPVLVVSHNKTLAAQLYSEFKSFFPHNAVEYFVSYYDYFQPEAYIPSSDTYIEKDLAINDDLERMRLSASASLISGRRDVIVVSSVSCIYGIGNPEDFSSNRIELMVGQQMTHQKLMYTLSTALFNRSVGDEFKRGEYRRKGEAIDIYAANGDVVFRVIIGDDYIEELWSINPTSGERIERRDMVTIHPASIFITTKEKMSAALIDIENDLAIRVGELKDEGKEEMAMRLKRRVESDLEMIKEIGYCKGIENYSRYFDNRPAGSRPFCLLDYFPKDFIVFIDESHVTIPQFGGMSGGDFSRKTNLVDYGWRLPAALDNRPLRFEELEALVNQVVYVSATPGRYEFDKSEGAVAIQHIRPTGLLDPVVEVKSSDNQIDTILEEIDICVNRGDKVLITTLTKLMAEEMYSFLDAHGVRCRYIHSDLDSLERIEHLQDFKDDMYDVLVGVNLLREGIDLPAVSLVMILDADKEGFLRSETSLVQTAGRAARNVNGRVILFARRETKAMREMIKQTEQRRKRQMEYNAKHNITPVGAESASEGIKINVEKSADKRSARRSKDDVILFKDLLNESVGMVAEGGKEFVYETVEELEKREAEAKKRMERAAANLDFTLAGKERDEMLALRDKIAKMRKKR